MVKPAFTSREQALLEGALVFLSGRQPQRTAEILDALDSLAGPVLVDAVTLSRDAYVQYQPVLTGLIADLNALLAKVKA